MVTELLYDTIQMVDFEGGIVYFEFSLVPGYYLISTDGNDCEECYCVFILIITEDSISTHVQQAVLSLIFSLLR